MNVFDRNDARPAALLAMVGAGTVAIVGGAFVLIFLLVVLRCFVIAQIWSWYLVPGLHVPQITLPVAFGLSLLIGFLAPSPNIDQDNRKRLKNGIYGTLGTLLAAWIGSFWM